MKKISLWIGGIAVLSTQTLLAVELHGYVRLGAGSIENGQGQECFKLSEAPAKYRLGNECDQYGELFGSQKVMEFSDHSKLSINAMAQFSNDYNKSLKFSGENGFTRLSQAYLNWENVPMLHGGNLWVGRRYYNRHDIHMSDFFYWNQSANGFGIDQFKVGNLDLSYVFSRKDSVFQEIYINRHDFTVSKIPMSQSNQLQFGISYIDADKKGWSFSLENVSSNVFNGKNTFAVQYGIGAGTGLSYTGNTLFGDNSKNFRVLDYVDWESNNKIFNGQFQVIYQITDLEQQDKLKWFSVGSRTAYVINDVFKISSEIGYDQINKSDETRRLTKLTIAPTLSLQGTGFYDRPELRVYYTYAYWNDTEKSIRDLVENNYTGTNHGSNFGIQLEYFW